MSTGKEMTIEWMMLNSSEQHINIVTEMLSVMGDHLYFILALKIKFALDNYT